MSEHSPTHHHQNGEHGTTRSYIVGFVLSLIFTFIPYFLVTRHILAGNGLVITILGIAVLQMAVQLVFFLHLGRGPKPLYNIVFFFATAGIIILTIGASLFIMDNLYRNMSNEEVTLRLAQEENIDEINGEPTGACNQTFDNHQVLISAGSINLNNVVAERCDTLTFVNNTSAELEIRFGSQANPVSYGGLDDVKVEANDSETITLNQTGDFLFHEKNESEYSGQFTVTDL